MTIDTENKRVLNVMLVEDDPADVMLIKKIFENSSLAKISNISSDGEEAIAYLNDETTTKPDIILLDINMPRKDGKQVLAELKTHDTLKRTPIIMLTSSKARNDVVECYSMHANSYVAKPSSIADHKKLLEAVEMFWFSLALLPTDKHA